MHKNRLEAFSDGVLAILITIMVLELKVPPGRGDVFELLALGPVFSAYILSFIYLAIYWNNHHHLFQAVKHVNGAVLWANMHLLFWLSLLPFATGWAGNNGFSPGSAFLYGFVLLMSAVAYYVLTVVLLKSHEVNSDLAIALGKDKKGKISLCLYLAGLFLIFYSVSISILLYVAVAVIWLVPDKRIEKVVRKS